MFYLLIGTGGGAATAGLLGRAGEVWKEEVLEEALMVVQKVEQVEKMVVAP